MKTKLLVVDDNVAMVELIKEYFRESSKIEVALTAYDGEEALDKIFNEEDKYDVLILDLIMPKKDGLYVLEELKKSKKQKNIIVLTSYNEPDTIRRVSEYGVRYFMLKPFDFKEFEKKILELIEGNKMQSQVIDLHDHNIQISITKMLQEKALNPTQFHLTQILFTLSK